MAFDNQAFEGGFTDAVYDAQTCFRALMDALANPGTIQPLTAETQPPLPLTPELGAIAQALFDHDTKVWLDSRLAASSAVREWLAFQTGFELVSEIGEANFALVSDVTQMPPLDVFAKGTSEYPDRSATIVMAIEGFAGAQTLQLQGPGIEHVRDFAPSALPVRFNEQWAANTALFPRGVDLVFAAPKTVAALPRSTKLIKNGN
ncbi:phosphonate C-P lyase system protein PhnH [Pseudochrobactrum sp. Wa41.01b-1]|uniref:phosphonate C-P lyase system protein PhnH n=1 Tax=Pseudochrobactrum sp. Wa41.01b-1 TaxID=2864102 RepID=UPI001C68FE05|nr:phosphonate C-P lyase system protein PhnH [Pseudochrobactrum sp. Wa41.01b-1]QYM72227.1 phosphonate C-P lyase system protein PhnH [Pseudochrobactrum sp. Wa41.01b-1]